MIALPFIAAWSGHTDTSREWSVDIVAAFAACGLKHEAVAAYMEIHPADLSRQLSGRDPLNLWRLTALPAAFWIVLFGIRVGRVGGVVLTSEQISFVRGAAVLGVKRMARMVLPQNSERQVS